MTPQIALLLGVIALAMVLFSRERLPADVVAMGIVLLLILSGLLSPERAFAGFGSDTVMMIGGLLVLTATLVHTGVIERVEKSFLRLVREHPRRLLPLLMVSVALLSTFISNTAATALFVPLTLSLSRKMKLRASQLLMPLAFAAILASSVTLISSSTNLVIGGLLQLYGLPPLGMFELTLVGLPILAVGLVYMASVGTKLIPARDPPALPEQVAELRPYLGEIVLRATSPLVGKSLAEARLGRDLDLTVLRISRADGQALVPQADVVLSAGDRMVIEGPRNALLRFQAEHGQSPESLATGLTPLSVSEISAKVQSEDVQVAEVILLPGSPLIGRTLKMVHFRQRYGMQVLGLNRRGRNLYRKLSDVILHTGDQLLVQGPRAVLGEADKRNLFRVVGHPEIRVFRRGKAGLAMAIFAGALLLAAFNVLPPAVAVWLGVLLVFVGGCITPDTAYRTIEWKVIVVIGSMLAIGQAMETTGTAAFLAAQIVKVAQHASPPVLLTVFFALTMALTQPMSNQAAAVIVLPIAIETALRLGLNPRTFAVMIAVGASSSFITPLEPSCLMVYGPGRYKFMDFIKVGSGLTLLIYLVAIVLVPLFWPL